MKPNKKTLVTAVSFLLIGIILTSIVWVYAQPTQPFTIAEGVYPSAPSFTISREGSTYYAKNAYGQNQFSSSNATTLIQNAIDAITIDIDPTLSAFTGGNGTILLTNADYELGTSGLEIRFSESGHYGGLSVAFQGEGEGTVLYYTGSGSALTIHSGLGWYYAYISDFRVWGNNRVNGSRGIYANLTGRNLYIERVEVRHMDIGVYIYNTNTVYLTSIKVSHCNTGIAYEQFIAPDGHSKANAIFLNDFKIGHIETYGIDVRGESKLITIEDGVIENTSVGIRATRVDMLNIDGIYFELNRGEADIVLGTSSAGNWIRDGTISNCWFDGNDVCDYAISVYRATGLVVDTCFSTRHAEDSFIWLNNDTSLAEGRQDITIINPYHFETFLLESNGVPNCTDTRLRGTVITSGYYRQAIGFIMWTDLDVTRGDVVVLSTNGTVDNHSASNEDIPFVILYGQTIGQPVVVAGSGMCQVKSDVSVTSGDTMVTDGAHWRSAIVNNAQTDPKKIIGWAIETEEAGKVWIRVNG